MNKQKMRNIQDNINNNELFGDYQRHILTDLLLSTEEVYHEIIFETDLQKSNEVAGVFNDIMELFRVG